MNNIEKEISQIINTVNTRLYAFSKTLIFDSIVLNEKNHQIIQLISPEDSNFHIQYHIKTFYKKKAFSKKNHKEMQTDIYFKNKLFKNNLKEDQNRYILNNSEKLLKKYVNIPLDYFNILKNKIIRSLNLIQIKDSTLYITTDSHTSSPSSWNQYQKVNRNIYINNDYQIKISVKANKGMGTIMNCEFIKNNSYSPINSILTIYNPNKNKFESNTYSESLEYFLNQCKILLGQTSNPIKELKEESLLDHPIEKFNDYSLIFKKANSENIGNNNIYEDIKNHTLYLKNLVKEQENNLSKMRGILLSNETTNTLKNLLNENYKQCDIILDYNKKEFNRLSKIYFEKRTKSINNHLISIA
jgi:hypothetical protein